MNALYHIGFILSITSRNIFLNIPFFVAEFFKTETKMAQNEIIFKKKKGFTVVANTAIRDESLSIEARGVYALIQSWITLETDDFVCSKAFIFEKSNTGEKKFDRIWNELKASGYLKMYCTPPAIWTAELLDEPHPEMPHTFYLNSNGEINSTNIERAEKKAEKEKAEYYPQKWGNTKRSNTKYSNTEGGNLINTINNNSNINTLSNHSINQAPKEKQVVGEKDGLIDNELVDKIKQDINAKALIEKNNISADEVAVVVDIIAELRTATKSYKVCDKKLSAETVRAVGNQINYEHIKYFIECFHKQNRKINNPRAYLRTAILNSPLSTTTKQTISSDFPHPQTKQEHSFDVDDFFRLACKRSGTLDKFSV